MKHRHVQRISGSNDRHLSFECELLRKERNDLTTIIRKTGEWPTSKPELTGKYFKAFLEFTSAIQADKLTNPEPNED